MRYARKLFLSFELRRLAKNLPTSAKCLLIFFALRLGSEIFMLSTLTKLGAGDIDSLESLGDKVRDLSHVFLGLSFTPQFYNNNKFFGQIFYFS